MSLNLVVLPGAPVMVPELSGQAHTELAEFVNSARAMLDSENEPHAPLMVLATGAQSALIPAVHHNLRRFGRAVPVGPDDAARPNAAQAQALPSTILLGWWWARTAQRTIIWDAAVILDNQASPNKPLDLAATAAWLYPQFEALHAANGTLLVVADGPAALSPKAPIPLRPSAVSLDASLTAFIDDAEPLITPDPTSANSDGWYSQPAWQVLQWLAHTAQLHRSIHAAPFGVGYHAAQWTVEQLPALPTTAAAATTTTPIVIIGPTGSGKSDLALELAERCDGEIVNVDAMQMYRGMDIGTAKVPPEQRRGIPHHLFDILDVTATASVADYQALAVETVEQIRKRGRRPIIVGGSMMYYQALVDDWAFPATDPQVRSRFEQRLEQIGVSRLHAELAAVDPDAASQILPTDSRRIVRALEVIEITGKPFAASRPVISTPRWGAQILGLSVDLPVLDQRLAKRTEAMFNAGLVDEVRRLEQQGLREGVTARRAIGYAHVLDALNESANASDLNEQERIAVCEQVLAATRRYVRRQRSWFRRDPRVRWLDATSETSTDLADRAMDRLGLTSAQAATQ